ncbi:MAG: DUF6690 family protein [Planctomycetota bacterium]
MALGRPLLMTGLLGAAVAAPIAVNEGPKHWPLLGGGAPATAPDAGFAPAQTPDSLRGLVPPTIHSPEGPGSLIYQSPAPLEGVGFVSLAELLRMDVTKEWVYARWSRKSTGLADPGLYGVRVPVVTGTAMTDLAGSLSYYFNADGRVDRLRFHGRTADTTALVAIAQSHYGMRMQKGMPGEQLYQTGAGGNVLCELRTRAEPVLWATSPHDSFVVDLEINRPGAGRLVERRPLTPSLPEPPPAAAAPRPVAPPAESSVAAAPGEPAAEDQGLGEAEAPTLTDAKRPAFRWPN